MSYQHSNLAWVTVSTGYGLGDTSIDLTTGHGGRLPQPGYPFFLVWWNYTDYPGVYDDPNAEIVLCTARSTDNITVTRAQGGTTGSTKNTASKTYRMMLVFTVLELENRPHWGQSTALGGANFTP